MSKLTDQNRFFSAAEELLFLRPEQIRLPRRGDLPRAEQNRVIRLAASVRRYGILEPLCVRPAADENGFPCYELMDGERRLRAACLCGLERIPCRVARPDAAELAKQAVFDRLRTKNPDIFEEAEVFSTLVRDHRMTQEEIARRLSLSQSAVANKIRLLQFSPAEREQILRAGLSERHARALLRVRDPVGRRFLLDAIIRAACSVAAAENLIDNYLADKQAQKSPPAPSNALPAPSNSPFSPPAPQASREAPIAPESADERAAGVHKFAVRDLRPLYNSIDRTLSIFRKTGAQVEQIHHETADGAEIVIRILRR